MIANYKRELSNNWQIQSSEKITPGGGEISCAEYSAISWFPTNVPSTVLATLVKNKQYQDPYFGTNMKGIPQEQFKVPWWYRTEFELSKTEANNTILLSFDGINYRASIWINGKQLATSKIYNGAFRRIKLDISNNIVSGNNILAIEVIPPEPGDFSIGFVDWNVDPPDRNMGIFRGVSLHINGGISIENPFVDTKINRDNSNDAVLCLSTELVNHTGEAISGVLTGVFDNIQLKKSLTLSPAERATVVFRPDEFPELNIKDAKFWWPYQIGEPDLHNLKLSLDIDNYTSDIQQLKFGIREVEDYVNEAGHRGFKINGKKVLIKGAGWTDDLFLQDTHESLEDQISYVKQMNLNCIRLEGFWGKDQKLYDLCDQAGILMIVGWSCHWEHEEYLGKPVDPLYGGVTEVDEIELISRSWEEQILWLRNHPAIFVWNVGSDMVPHPDLERKYIETFNKYDNTRPYLNSTGGVGSEQGIITEVEVVSEISGSSRVKMLGPYAYTPPVYWYTDKKLGGAYGFNTETCPGANIPPLDSIQKMIPSDHLWPIDETWEYHCGKNDFSKLDRVKKAIAYRYGPAKNIKDFAYKAQLLNYELMRPMFEAFQVNKHIATGVIQWMLNSALPNMYWQLYDSYLMPNGAFYSTRKACEPLHLAYNYGDHSINIINDHLHPVADHRAYIRIFDISSHEVFSESVVVNVLEESSSVLMKLPENMELTDTWFLDLRLFNHSEKQLGNNFYWLSLKRDELDYEAKFDNWPFYTPSKSYADYTSLHSLKKASIRVKHQLKMCGDRQTLTVWIENPTDQIAFFIYLRISGKEGRKAVLPVWWNDNYITLLPHEIRVLTASFKSSARENDLGWLEVSGWNIEHREQMINTYGTISD
ncbi:MAG: glycoside hydrolase family 2 [Bacteroidetes bacterium]|jgi:exo-1,4-beta-D-glucosaminidase|nr:glycoside hydrolase family 2 [Bacteroidota bacterium]MBT4399892.1 glycoside hydrolase family 2 [Bacteroidota bacterium]MBT5427397.1 glycoside hydrolase family 2 [Bacteroidota bacterium]MBT7095130.1 glycoside hydrolase family 2 [Bacteroidota bacterium]MBT7466256.1 glycoside hydrolase family 2 [Bacteroidota bacterium]